MKMLLLIGLLCLADCTQQGRNDRLASRDEQAFAIRVANQLQSRKFGELIEEAQPELRQQLPKYIETVGPILGQVSGPFRLQSVQTSSFSAESTTKTFIFQSGSGNRWAIVRVVLQFPDNAIELAGLNVKPFNSDPSRFGNFDINGRGTVGYLWLGMMLACACTCIFATFLIWRRRWLEQRWLWTLGSLFGFAGFDLNWSTGDWAVVFLSLSFLGAQAMKVGEYAPWLLSFTIPVVAIVVIVRWFRYGKNDSNRTEAEDF